MYNDKKLVYHLRNIQDDLLNQQKKKGIGVMFIGEDLDVLMALSDRLMVIHDGKVMGIVNPKEISKEDVGMMMLGDSQE